MSLSLNNFEVSIDDGKLPSHILVELNSLLSFDLFNDLKFFVVIQHSHFILLLGFFILIHGAILCLLVEWLSNVFRETNILKNNASELKTLVLEHFVEELKHFTSLVLSFDLVHLEIGLASRENTDSLGDCRLNLFVQLIDTDVVDELFNRLVVLFAAEDSSNFDVDKDVIESRA